MCYLYFFNFSSVFGCVAYLSDYLHVMCNCHHDPKGEGEVNKYTIGHKKI